MISPRPAVLKKLTPGVGHKRGVFETVLGVNGEPVFLREHLTRLFRGAKSLRIAPIVTTQDFRSYIRATLAVSGLSSVRLRLLIWRERQTVHFAVVVLPYQPVSASARQRGYRVVTARSRINERHVCSFRKGLDYSLYLRAYEQATAVGVDEAVLLNLQGDIAEGSRTNIFVVKDNQLLTPPLTSGCLSGITRKIVMKLARQSGLVVRSQRLHPSDALGADEIFLTNSLLGVMPLVSLDGSLIKNGKPGPVTKKVIRLYDALLLATVSLEQKRTNSHFSVCPHQRRNV